MPTNTACSRTRCAAADTCNSLYSLMMTCPSWHLPLGSGACIIQVATSTFRAGYAGRALQSANAQLPSIPYFSAKVADNSCTTRVRASANLISRR